ncbi:hypothetical protein NEIELOOT_01749 [Neisseria elongata subsp. glycolytica ATCC 29315]|uniref:Uncharacterized protein n=1 Tax=Neisseria elongata subsp. glycolytica ATCC 29315 TaxID=546263 RepID=D4DRQ6_NEIEG|nr:hypothetical protein NEIELOOT_01749 [Neisseria elongata subsp. glycolytica ATCC 29315]
MAGLCLDRLGKNLLLRFGCRNIIVFSSLPQAVSASKTAAVRARYLWWRFMFYFQLSIGGNGKILTDLRVFFQNA